MNKCETDKSQKWFCCWCGFFGPMSFNSTPKCVNEGCPHSCCENCKKESGETGHKKTKQIPGARPTEEIRISYTQAAQSCLYEAPAEPQPRLTPTLATAQSFATPGMFSAGYTSDIAVPGSAFDNPFCMPSQSLSFDSSTPFFGNSSPILSGGSLLFDFSAYPCQPSAPLSPSALDFDFDSALEPPFYACEDEGDPDLAGAPTITQHHIAALQMDRELVQVSQVAESAPHLVQNNDAHTDSSHNGKRPREASPDVPAKSSRKAPSQRSAKKSVGQQDGRILTCPFVWVNHERHSECLKLRLRRIRDVKQHLHRAHEQPYYCRRCKAVFKNGADSAEAQEHDNSDTRCPRREHAKIPDGVTKLQFESMKKSKADLITQWNNIWDVLFPDAIEAKPQSPFLTERLSDDITALVVFSQTQGRQILQANPRLTAREIDLVVYGMEIVLDAWTSKSKDCLHI